MEEKFSDPVSINQRLDGNKRRQDMQDIAVLAVLDGKVRKRELSEKNLTIILDNTGIFAAGRNLFSERKQENHPTGFCHRVASFD